MAQLSTFSPLGNALRAARKAHSLTQHRLATAANLTAKTVRLSEQGKGRLQTFYALLKAMDLELRGRNLPAGPIGPALARLRQRHQISRRQLAMMLDVSRNTLATLEADGPGRLQTLEAVGVALATGFYLSPKHAPRRFYNTTATSSAYHGWQTPPELLANLTNALGPFDMDPCAPPTSKQNAPVQARVRLTATDDGLLFPWRGLVFCNPPYGRILRDWIAKCHLEGTSGRACVVALIPARTDTKWWHKHIADSAHVFMLKGRLSFGDSENSAPFPSALAIWGASHHQIAQLQMHFPSAWYVAP